MMRAPGAASYGCSVEAGQEERLSRTAGAKRPGMRICVLLGLVSISIVLMANPSGQAQQEPLPTFRAGIEAVQIHAFVTDTSGKPVTDLTADEFEIVENGVPRPVTTFSLVNIPQEPPRGAAAE